MKHHPPAFQGKKQQQQLHSVTFLVRSLFSYMFWCTGQTGLKAARQLINSLSINNSSALYIFAEMPWSPEMVEGQREEAKRCGRKDVDQLLFEYTPRSTVCYSISQWHTGVQTQREGWMLRFWRLTAFIWSLFTQPSGGAAFVRPVL